MTADDATVRRLAALCLLALGLLAAGCAGPDGERAQELLAQADAAGRNMRSATFELQLNADYAGQQIGVALTGGGYWKGARAGDVFLEATTSGALAGFDFGLLSNGGRVWLRTNGKWQQVPGSASLKTSLGAARSGDLGSAAFLELARYVKEVHVTEGQLVNGEPTATISGTIDTAGLVEAMAKLQRLSQLAGSAAPDLSQLSEHVGDTRATIAISERTHIVRGAVVNLSIDAEGKRVDLQLVYRLHDVNKPVRFPRAS